MPLHGVVQYEDHWSREYDDKGLKLWNYWKENSFVKKSLKRKEIVLLHHMWWYHSSK